MTRPVHHLRLLFLLPLALSLSVPAAAQQDTERIARLAEEMLDAGADGAALRSLANVDQQSLHSLEVLGPERSDVLREAWDESFAESRLRGDVVSYIASRESANDVGNALEWLRQPAVSRATQRMRDHTGPEGDAAFARWATSLADADIDPERAEIVQLISQRSGEDRAGDLVLRLAEVGVRGGHAAAPPSDRPDLAGPLARLRDFGPTIKEQALAQNRLYYYFVLQDLTLPQLRAYADALAQPAGAWYVRTMHAALVHAVERAGDRLVTQVNDGVSRLR